MKTFGYFDDKNREYVITDPATPFPWINYHFYQNARKLTINKINAFIKEKAATFHKQQP